MDKFNLGIENKLISSKYIEPRIKLEFGVVGDDLDLNLFTKIIGIDPTECYLKGDRVYDNLPLPLRVETAWCYAIEKRGAYNVDDLLKKMYSLLIDKVEDIILFQRNKKIDYYVHLILYIDEDVTPIIKITPYFLDLLTKINAYFEVFIY